MANLLASFAATKEPVQPEALRVRGGRKVEYDGNTYRIQKIESSNRKNKKYMATVKNVTTGEVYKPHWGHTEYDDYYVHRDKQRRENFQKRHGAILLKDGRPAAEDPRQPAYYATKANWSYMSSMANFDWIDNVRRASAAALPLAHASVGYNRLSDWDTPGKRLDYDKISQTDRLKVAGAGALRGLAGGASIVANDVAKKVFKKPLTLPGLVGISGTALLGELGANVLRNKVIDDVYEKQGMARPDRNIWGYIKN